MAVKKTIELDVNTSAGLRAMDELGLSFEQAFTEADNLSGQIGELEDALYAMAAAGQTNTKEYKELSEQIGVYKKVIIDTDMQIDAMSQTTSQNLGGALGGVTSGFELGAGAMGAFGTESEAVEKALLRVQSAMAISQGIQGIREAIPAFKGLKASVLGASKGMKLFRGALVATGIGAIVLLITSLYAGFDKVSAAVSKAVNWFKEIANETALLKVPIDAIVAGYNKVREALEYLGIADTAQTRQAKENAKDRVANAEKESEAVGKRYDFEIEKARAAGKDTYKLEQEKRAAFRETVMMQIKAIIKLATLNKEYTDEQKEQVEDLKNSIKESSNQSRIAQITNQKAVNDKARELNKKRKEDEQKAADDRLAILKKEREENDKLFEDLELETREQVEAVDITNLAEDPEILAEDAKQASLFAIRQGWNQKSYESDEEYAQRKAELADKGFEHAKNGLESAKLISEMILDSQLKKAGNNEAQKEKIRERAFKRDKALNLSMALINGAQAITSILAQYPKFDGGIAMIGALASSAVATTASIAKIAATSYSGGGSSVSSGGGSDVRGFTDAPSFNIVGNSSENQLAQSLGNQEQAPIKTYVVSDDVTTAQSLDRNKIQTASL